MALCPKCGKEIADKAVVCKHCHATIGTPQRPTGVTAIAAVTLLGAAYNLLGAMTVLFESNAIVAGSYVLGIHMPDAVAVVITLIIAGVALYCGLGFLKQKAKARLVFLWLAGYGILNSLITVFRFPYSALTTILSVAVLGFVVYYLVRRKDYFTN